MNFDLLKWTWEYIDDILRIIFSDMTIFHFIIREEMFRSVGLYLVIRDRNCIVKVEIGYAMLSSNMEASHV